MKKNNKVLIVVALIAGTACISLGVGKLISSLTPTLETIEYNVLRNEQEFFDTTGNLPRAQAVVTSVTFTEVSNGFYTGTATVLWGRTYDTSELGLEVQRHGSTLSIDWTPLAASFINQMNSIWSQ